MECHCPRCRTRADGGTPWQGKISRTALRAACERLGVRSNVRIKRGPCAGTDPELVAEGWSKDPELERDNSTTYGMHAVKSDGTHIIEINNSVSPGVANECLLHELTHAAQTERFASVDDFQRAYMRAQDAFGYEANPFEREAHEASSALTGEFKVVVA